MSSVVISGDTSGAITLSAPAVAGTNTITLPAATGTAMVSGNMPAFFAYLNGNQTISRASWTKIAFNAEIFDTNNCFDSTTNYRFTPTVAGYYLISTTSEDATGLSSAYQIIGIYKNGTIVSRYLTPCVSYGASGTTNLIVYCNGSTDYIEAYQFFSGSGSVAIDGSAATLTYITGSLIRGA
jgi:hypothetical protein